MYCTVADVVDTVHSCPFSAQKNWLLFIVFLHFPLLDSTHQLLHFMDFSCASHGAATRLTALINNVPALINQDFVRGKRWDHFLFSRNCSKKQFAL